MKDEMNNVKCFLFNYICGSMTLVILLIGFSLVGCECELPPPPGYQTLYIPLGFDVDLNNNTVNPLDQVELSYDGLCDASSGYLGPGNEAMSNARRPTKGPMVLTWQDEQGNHYRTEIPVKPEYLVKPKGVLVVRIRPNNEVSVRGIRAEEMFKDPYYQVGDIYKAVKQ